MVGVPWMINRLAWATTLPAGEPLVGVRLMSRQTLIRASPRPAAWQTLVGMTSQRGDQSKIRLRHGFLLDFSIPATIVQGRE